MGSHPEQSSEPRRGTIRLLSTGPIHVDGNLSLAVGQPLEVMPVAEAKGWLDYWRTRALNAEAEIIRLRAERPCS